MYYSAKSEDRNHQVGDIISFEKATGNTAFYGEGIYFSDCVEIAYTRGAGCVYVFDRNEVDATVVKTEKDYQWFLTNQVDYKVTSIKDVSVEEALHVGWAKPLIDVMKMQRKNGFKFYYVTPAN